MLDKVVSVIVPVYNVEKELPRCLDSILKQTYRNLEILLVDDGSTDYSGIICDQYASADQRIRVWHKENGGVSSARNLGLDYSTGEYISFIDADDWIEECMFEKMICSLEDTRSDFAVCKTDSVYLQDGELIYKDRKAWKHIKESTCFREEEIYYHVFACSAILCNKIFRKKIIGSRKFLLNKTYGEDFLFFLEILDSIHTAVLIPTVFYHYFRGRTDSVVSSGLNARSIEMLQNAQIAYKILLSRGYGDLGVHRLSVAVKEVYSKIPFEQDIFRKNKIYIDECRKTIRSIQIKDSLTYLRSEEFPVGDKIKFVLLKKFPHIAIILKARKNSQ